MSVRAHGTLYMSVWLECGNVRVCAHRFFSLREVGCWAMWGCEHSPVWCWGGGLWIKPTRLSPAYYHPNFA